MTIYTQPMSDERLEEIKRLRKTVGDESWNRYAKDGESMYGTGTPDGVKRLAACVNSIPELLDEIERLRAELQAANKDTNCEKHKCSLLEQSHDVLKLALRRAEQRERDLREALEQIANPGGPPDTSGMENPQAYYARKLYLDGLARRAVLIATAALAGIPVECRRITERKEGKA